MSNVSQLATPHLRTVTAVLPSPVRAVPTVAEGVLRLPEGAIVAPWPQAGLPAELIGGDVPMVGYLVLVPADRVPVDRVAADRVPVNQVSADRLSAGRPSADRSTADRSAAAAPVAAVPVAAVPPLRSVSGGIQLDLERRTARIDGELVELTYLEFELLAHLTANPHRVHTRDHLVTAVWGYGHIGDGRTVDVHVARLRRKLGARYRAGIVTVRRVGYKYVPPKQG
ncbi:winged helix-turn-helix domain-containing protein [Streptacidiphilus sp. N1-12]|uniref:Winged helix-turn-helix domain-containing protein n=2 Tax=Streptacidiphilus alkalitolerans TaxID=3342712 RepID=A0ABV6WHQ9_9ACTN